MSDDLRFDQLMNDFLASHGLTPDQMSETLRGFALRVWDQWKDYAAQELNSTEQDYVEKALTEFGGMQQSGLSAVITLADHPAIAGMLEHGSPPYDLRATILREGTSNLKRSAKGHLYCHIPFRHGTPGTSGKMGGIPGTHDVHQGGGRSGGYTIRKEAKGVKRSVYAAAKALDRTTTLVGDEGRQTHWGDRLGEGVGGAERLRPHHVTDPYAGMVKVRKVGAGGAKHSTGYYTFRTISTNPDTERGGNWRHPGFRPRNFARKTVQWIEQVWPDVVSRVLRGLPV